MFQANSNLVSGLVPDYFTILQITLPWLQRPKWVSMGLRSRGNHLFPSLNSLLLRSGYIHSQGDHNRFMRERNNLKMGPGVYGIDKGIL